ncbi:MAG: hypothetical protein SH850_04410 [Planctomycetaceae bacterium]|nr:hypothetical protein [Planctomycetaceae bacterium]
MSNEMMSAIDAFQFALVVAALWWLLRWGTNIPKRRPTDSTNPPADH